MSKILLVGNDPAEREVRALVMEFGGHRCRIAASLKEAAKLLREESFNLVVTDFKPNGSSPAQIAKSLKREFPEILLLALTESAKTVIQEADAMVTVPCPPEKLLQHIEHALARVGDPSRRTPVSVAMPALAAKAR